MRLRSQRLVFWFVEFQQKAVYLRILRLLLTTLQGSIGLIFQLKRREENTKAKGISFKVLLS